VDVERAIPRVDIAREFPSGNPVPFDDLTRVDVNAKKDGAFLAEFTSPDDVDTAYVVVRRPTTPHPTADDRSTQIEEHTTHVCCSFPHCCRLKDREV
jgi:hypothetical protein